MEVEATIAKQHSTSDIFRAIASLRLLLKDQSSKYHADPRRQSLEGIIAGAGTEECNKKETETAIALYWGACHRATEANVYKSGTQLGKKLGYAVNYPFAEGDEKILSMPSDVLKW